MDCSLPCSSVRGILQARILEWVAISFSRRSSQPRDRTRQTLYHLSHQGSFQEEVISLQSSAQAEALRPDSCVWDWGTTKWGRIGRVKERKERGKGREVNKVSRSLPVGVLWPVVRVRRRPGTKGSQLRPLGLVH